MKSLGCYGFVFLLVLAMPQVIQAFDYPWLLDAPRYNMDSNSIKHFDSVYAKRMMPMKERRAPSDFDDFGNMMRSIDAIQKPRFG
ncbi:unnamed protein product [Auanema sp. JU1783]|nr:unnamed protein product [Auanema sp. JU1783]